MAQRILKLLIAGATLFQAPLLARDDWQFWQEATLSIYEKGPYKLNFFEQVRFRDDFHDYFFRQAKITSAFAFKSLTAVSAGYSFVQSLNALGRWQDEHRPELDWHPQWNVKGAALGVRLRLESRFLEGRSWDADWRGRARLQLLSPGLPFYKPLRFFANEEVFYDLRSEKRNQNRLFSGFQLETKRHGAFGMAWGLQSLLSESAWKDDEILQLQGKFRF